MEVAKEVSIPDQLVNQIDRFVAQVDSLKIKTQEHYEVAAAYRKQNKQLIKQVEGTFGPIATKQYAAWKETKNQEKKYLGPLKLREAVLQRAMDEWVAEVRRKEAEEERLRQAQLAEAQGEEEQEVERILDSPVPSVAPPVSLRTPGTSFVEEWYYEVVDKKAVPEEYKIVNHQMVQAVVKAMKNQAKIPGIVVKHRTKTRQRG